MDKRSSDQPSGRHWSMSGSHIQTTLTLVVFILGFLLLAGCTDIAEEQFSRLQLVELPQVDLNRLNPKRSGTLRPYRLHRAKRQCLHDRSAGRATDPNHG